METNVPFLDPSGVKDAEAEGEKELTLKRRLSLWNAVSLIISVMIGAGIFVTPSTALKRAGSVGEALLVWAGCGCISLMGALSFAELATVVPQSGAEYSFFRAAYSPLHTFWGPLPCFLYIWVVVLILRPAEAAIIILVFAEYVNKPLTGFLNLCPESQRLVNRTVAVLSLGISTYINTKSVKLFMKMQNIFSSCKIIVCVVVICGGIYNLSLGNVKYLSKGFEGSKTGIKDIVLSIYSGLWAYDGWSSATAVSEEITNPDRNIPRSLFISVPCVTILFTMMNVAYMSVLSVPEMISVPAVAEAFGEKILGPIAFVVPVGVALATFSCSMASQFGTARLTFAAGRQGHMPEVLSYINIDHLTPAPAVCLQGVLTLIFIVSGDIVDLVEFASFLIWTFYGLAFAALIVLRRTKPNVKRPYKVPLVIPVLLSALCCVLAAVPTVMHPSPGHLGALAFIGIGLMVYYPLVYRRITLPGVGKLYHFVQVLMKMAPTTKVPEV